MTNNLFDESVLKRDDGMVPITRLLDLEIGIPKRFIVKGQSILLTAIKVNSNVTEVTAFSTICPHALGDLSQGWVTEDEIECPLHYYRYNMRTGDCVDPRGGPHLRLYPVKIEGDLVLVSVQKPRWMEQPDR